jgi:ATP-dependent DNA helicase 2 subunit 1
MECVCASTLRTALTWQDLLTYGITINTFFIDKPDHRFNPTLYWNVSDRVRKVEAAVTIRTSLAASLTMQRQATKTRSPKAWTSSRICSPTWQSEMHPRECSFRYRCGLAAKMETSRLVSLGKSRWMTIANSSYSLVSEQGKGVQKYVRMRGQVVEEVAVKTEHTSAVRLPERHGYLSD